MRRAVARDSSSSLAQALGRSGKLLRDFQSRRTHGAYLRDLESQLPDVVYEVGEPLRTDYRSDKDDPETRAPGKRAHDPDGVQGIWKRFTHKHAGGGIRFYTTLSCYQDAGGQGAPASALDVVWPQVVTFLSIPTEVALASPTGRRWTFSFPQGYTLWAFPDSRTLVAMPEPATIKKIAGRVFVWRGGELCVTWRGIQG